MARKTVPFTKDGITRLPNNKPAVYNILTEGGKLNYVGVAKRGRLQERIREHLPGQKDAVPGAMVQVRQAESIKQAKQTEAQAITRQKPKYNDRGK
ncbi:MAG: hypothetical protein M0Z85_06710 [Gammaproteobacteria bacterium]|nr:hypothetical protein [Gammaproteobacteria bacterium]